MHRPTPDQPAGARLALVCDGVDTVANFREQDDDLEQGPLDGFGEHRLAAVGLEIGLFEFAGLKVPQLFDINGHGGLLCGEPLWRIGSQRQVVQEENAATSTPARHSWSRQLPPAAFQSGCELDCIEAGQALMWLRTVPLARQIS